MPYIINKQRCRMRIIVESLDEKEKSELCISYESVFDAGETVRRVIPLLMVRGRWEGEQMSLPLGFEVLNPGT